MFGLDDDVGICIIYKNGFRTTRSCRNGGGCIQYEEPHGRNEASLLRGEQLESEEVEETRQGEEASSTRRRRTCVSEHVSTVDRPHQTTNYSANGCKV